MFRIVILLAFTLLVGSLAGQRSPAVQVPADLKGRSLDEVLAIAGVPKSMGYGPHSLSLHYDDAGEHGVRLHGEVVVMVSPEYREFGEVTPVPARGFYLGQQVADAMAQLDSPASSCACAAQSEDYSFPNGVELHLAHGRVIGFRTR